MDYSKFDDEALVHLIERAQPEALSELYDRYSRLVFSLARHMVGESELAEEITQDVFFRVWEKAYSYRPDQGKVATWLSSIARNRSIDLIRQLNVRPEGHSVGWEELLPASLPASDGHLPEEATVQSIEAQRVRAALASLPEEQQRALALAYFRGFSHREIAEYLGEPLGTIKTRIRMAMQRLRGLLGDEQIVP